MDWEKFTISLIGSSNNFLASFPDFNGRPSDKQFWEFYTKLLSEIHKKNGKFPAQVRAIIDEMAVFKDFTRKEIAVLFMKYYSEYTGTFFTTKEANEQVNEQVKGIEKPVINGIIFFDDATNKPALLNRQFIVTILHGTRPDAIFSMTGFHPNELFSIYDNSHITGVDITQIDEAVGLVFVNFKTLASNAQQATMRLRKFFSKQTAFFCYPQNSQNEIFGEEALDINVTELFKKFVANEDRAYNAHFLAVGPQKLTSLARSLVHSKGKEALATDKTIFFHETKIDIMSFPFFSEDFAFGFLE